MKKTFGFILLFLALHTQPLATSTIYGKNYQLIMDDVTNEFTAKVKEFLDRADQHYQSFFERIGLRRLYFNRLTLRGYANQADFRQSLGGSFRGFMPGAYYIPSNMTAHFYNAGDERITFSSLLHAISRHYIGEVLPMTVFIAVSFVAGF